MSALSSKIWKASGSAHLPAQFFPQCRPCFPIQVAHVPIKFYSNPASQKPDEAMLHKFKRIAALRQDLERCNWFKIYNNPKGYAGKVCHEGNRHKKIYTDAREVFELMCEYNKAVFEMRQNEYEEERNEIWAKISDAARTEKEEPVLA